VGIPVDLEKLHNALFCAGKTTLSARWNQRHIGGYARTKADRFITQCQRIVPDAGTLFSATRV
jgi:hypothetical protein